MDQQVYSGGFGTIRLVPQDDHQQNFIMADDSQQQHIVYSPIKTNDMGQMQAQQQHQTQFISQDESMGNQYLIQQSSTPQQVFYTNLSPPNQNANRIVQQTVAINPNLIQQQSQPKQLVLQTPQKVVVQRAPDIITNNANLTQLVDQQNQQQTIQYNFQQQSVDQNHQIIIHQQQPNQMKQTIYPQQGGQILSPQPQYIQLQSIQTQNAIVQPGTKIIMPNNASPLRYSLVQQKSQPVQQIQNQQTGQVMQIQQANNEQQNTVKFRPRAFTPMRITRTVNPQQMQVAPNQQRPRARMPQPRLIRPIAQSPLQQQQNSQQQQQNSPQTRILQANIGNRLSQTMNNGQQFILVQQDGQQFLVTHPMNTAQNQSQMTQSPQLVRTVINRRIEQPQNNNNNNNNNGNNVTANNSNQNFQMQQNETSQEQNSSQTEEVAPTTSTLLRKEGDCDDLEDSITATAISKGNRPEQPGASINNSMPQDDFRRRSIPQSTPQRVGVVRPIMTTPGMALNRTPVHRSSSLQIIRQRTPPRPQFQHGSNHELGVHERESAKMLVILDNGEQRLITFTLPRETCTVQELLDQVGITIGAESNIECIENPGSEIDYIVKVGNFGTRDTTEMTKAAENHIRQQAAQQKMGAVQPKTTQSAQQTNNETPKSPESTTKLPPAKFVEGFFAVCTACGFSGSDHAKCERCHRIFTDDVKTVRMPSQLAKNPQISLIAGVPQPKIAIGKTNQDRKDHIEAIQKKHQIAAAEAHRKQLSAVGRGRGGLQVANGMITTVRGRGRAPKKPTVHEIVTLSSDDETDSDGTKSHNSKNSSDKKNEQTATPKKHFEPDIVDDVPADDFIRLNVTDYNESEQKTITSVTCRTIRIGSYKFDSKESVFITSKGIKIIAPSVKNVKDQIVLNIQKSEIVKFVTHFSKQLSIIFIYTKPSCGRYIVEQLQMTQVNDKSPYYSPLSRNETQRKIILLIENVSEETRNTLKSIYDTSILEEISNRDANELLVRSTGIPLTGSQAQSQNPAPENTISAQEAEMQKILTYPRGRGGITITVYDYLCLGTDNYLNDVIIDFYLKYTHTELLTKEQQSKAHMFSTFFYKRLTTMTKDARNLTAAQKRHQRVQSWTKNVDLFEKEFIIIPINEQSHWFLAIVCFPNLTEPHTMDTNQPIKLTLNQKKTKKKLSVQIGSTTITPLSKKDDSIEVHDDQTSERDEAEGDDSELGSNVDSEEEEVIDKGQPVKVPCILIFDSLGGTSRARVVATLRDYLTCEYKAKYPNAPARLYNKTNMLGCLVKAPQQQNFTDCGLFLLQYVEQFFKDPVKDFRIPIKTLSKWFHPDIVTRKREDIANLIKQLMTREGFAQVEIPDIDFPTKDGKILEVAESQESAAMDDAFEDPDYTPTEEESNNESGSQEGVTKKVYLPSKKRSIDKVDNGNGESSVAKTPKLNKTNKT